MSLDLSFDYESAKKKIAATSAYKDLKEKFDKAQEKSGDSQEKNLDSIQSKLDQVKEQTKRFQKDIKTQFEQLLDLNNVTGGKGSNTISYIKRLLIQTLKT
jgi:predicted nuclease with TOPRIM domain